MMQFVRRLDPGRYSKFQFCPCRRQECDTHRVKLGLHAGSCIAVTTGDVLDYFGATVNIAVQLEHQCRGGEVIVSEAVAKDTAAEAALADRTLLYESAMLRGVSAPVRFVRVDRRTKLPVDRR